MTLPLKLSSLESNSLSLYIISFDLNSNKNVNEMSLNYVEVYLFKFQRWEIAVVSQDNLYQATWKRFTIVFEAIKLKIPPLNKLLFISMRKIMLAQPINSL